MNSTMQNALRLIFVVVAAFTFLENIPEIESVSEHKVIETLNGKVRGIGQKTLFKGHDFYSFKGIPYAKSPIGELRFKPPEPIDSWAPTVRDAFEHGAICIQPPLSGNLSQSEDCLFLNVYVPVVQPNETLPVMVFLHGGGFVYGDADSSKLSPDFLLEQGVILVTLNYRLGILGFLSLGTPEYSGNMALKDQQLALKWIHSNIERFSGDNQRITVFGESAGSASTSLHLLSSESRKFFRNAIPMSGSPDNLWALSDKDNYLPTAYKIANDLGEPKKSFEELVEFLKSVPAARFAEFDVSEEGRILNPKFRPIVERKDAVRPFITDLPERIYNESEIKIDVLYSFCSVEMILFYWLDFLSEIRDLNELNRNFSLPLPFRGVNLAFDSPGYQQIAREIREFYFKDAAVDEKTLQQYVALLSDISLAYGIERAAKRHAEKSPSKAYLLRFSVTSRLSFIHRQNISSILQGAAHADDLHYVFRDQSLKSTYDDIIKNKDDQQSQISLRTIENMTKLYANFAKYGNPVHNGEPIAEFLPVQADRVNFVDVTNDGLILGIEPNQRTYEFWTNIERKVHQIQNSS